MNEKGITLVALIVTIVIILILVGGTVYTGNKIIVSARLQTLNTNMLLIQAKIKTYAEKDAFKGGDGSELKGKLMDTEEYLPIVNELKEKNVIQDGEVYYIWDKEVLAEAGLDKIQLDTDIIYIVDYKEEDIIYSKGYKHTDGNIYYNLSITKYLTVNQD